MTKDTGYNLLEEIEKEYYIFMENLDGIDNKCFDVKIDEDNKTPKEILVEQIELIIKCISQKGYYNHTDYKEYSYEELKYTFNLMHMNLMSWIESLSDDSKVIMEYENGNYDTIAEWFDKSLIKEFKAYNKEIRKWKSKFENEKDKFI